MTPDEYLERIERKYPEHALYLREAIRQRDAAYKTLKALGWYPCPNCKNWIHYNNAHSNCTQEQVSR